jgi:hypothetical protein
MLQRPKTTFHLSHFRVYGHVAGATMFPEPGDCRVAATQRRQSKKEAASRPIPRANGAQHPPINWEAISRRETPFVRERQC